MACWWAARSSPDCGPPTCSRRSVRRPYQIDDAVERREAIAQTALDLHLDTFRLFVRGDGALVEVGFEHGPGLIRAMASSSGDFQGMKSFEASAFQRSSKAARSCPGESGSFFHLPQFQRRRTSWICRPMKSAGAVGTVMHST